MKKPVKADFDINCFVYIRKYNHIEEDKKHGLSGLIYRAIHKCDPTGVIYTKFYEPFRNVEMKPGTTVASKSDRVYTGKFNGINHYRIEEGFVNGMLRGDTYGVAVPYKAIIPAGTEFYINNGLFRIAARKIKITREKVTTVPPLQDTLAGILPTMLNEIFGDGDEVSPGFYYLNDGTYLNPNKAGMDFLTKVCGIVSGVNGDKVTIMSIDEISSPWCTLEYQTKVCCDSDIDSDGESVMLTLMRNEHYGDEFVAARWCSKYEISGGIRGSWHFGCPNEVIDAIRNNMMEVNLAIANMNHVYSILTQTYGDYKLLDCLSSYWTSVDSSNDYAYAVDGPDGTLIRCHKKLSERNVRAFMTRTLF